MLDYGILIEMRERGEEGRGRERERERERLKSRTSMRRAQYVIAAAIYIFSGDYEISIALLLIFASFLLFD